MTINRRHLLLGSLSGAAMWATPALAAPPGARPPQSLNAADFGARANAAGDQTRLLQRAIDLAARAHRPLWLPAGRYFAADLQLRAGSHLVGVAGKTRIALTYGPALLSADGADGVALDGLTFDGAGVTLPRDAGLIHLNAGKDLRVHGCTVLNANGNGFGLFHCSGAVTGSTITSAADNAIYAVDNSRLTLAGNTIRQSGNGGIRVWQSVKRFDGSVVSGNTIEDTAARAGGSGQNGNAINIFRAAGVTVRDNLINRAAFSAVRGNAASNFAVIGNRCFGFGETAMYAEFEYENARFIDNVIDDAANGIAVTNFDVGGHGGEVRGNVVRNIGQRVLSTLTDGSGNGFGISVEADTAAAGNTIENCAYAGLRIGFGPYLRNVTASGNTIGRSPYGIVVSVVKGAGVATITGNRIDGATRGAIVGLEWHKAVTGDLSQGGAEKYPQLHLSGNQVG